jgi:hypothetical protein
MGPKKLGRKKMSHHRHFVSMTGVLLENGAGQGALRIGGRGERVCRRSHRPSRRFRCRLSSANQGQSFRTHILDVGLIARARLTLGHAVKCRLTGQPGIAPLIWGPFHFWTVRRRMPRSSETSFVKRLLRRPSIVYRRRCSPFSSGSVASDARPEAHLQWRSKRIGKMIA